MHFAKTVGPSLHYGTQSNSQKLPRHLASDRRLLLRPSERGTRDDIHGGAPRAVSHPYLLSFSGGASSRSYPGPYSVCMARTISLDRG